MQKTGEKIALLVKARGWQQKEFAAHVGYSAEHFSRLLKTDPLSAKALRRIAKGLDISPEELIQIEVIRRGQMPGQVSEPDSLYNARRGAELPTGEDVDFLRQEIVRLHTELDRVSDMLAREQALSASLAETLKNLSGKKLSD